MRRRQTTARQWLILRAPFDSASRRAVRQVLRGSGVLVLDGLDANEWRWLRVQARMRRLTLVFEEPRSAARVHNLPELRRALLNRVKLILLSPMFHTASHRDWAPLARMRAAAFARLANRRLIALGGMNARRYAKIAQLGFTGWAGISAFRT